MCSRVKLSVDCRGYEFSSGDYISGEVTLELAKECRVKSLIVTIQGKASVRWENNYIYCVSVNASKEIYFNIKQDVLNASQGNIVIPQGRHVYPFTFQIPERDLPPSCIGRHGSIWYTLKANLSRSMRLDTKADTFISVVNKRSTTSDPLMMAPQHQAIEERMKVFTTGTVKMDVNIARTGYRPGEAILVVASIYNGSPHDVKPSYYLYKKHSFFANKDRKVYTESILTEVGDPIPPSEDQTVTRILSIPKKTNQSVLNCNLIKIEYRLKVILSVKKTLDPEVKFPIIILPYLHEREKQNFFLAN